jgi:diguanylate cyclase
MATADNDWKSKYLDALDDIEKAQQLEKKRLEVLRKGVVRVSVAADGQDEALDADLADLRAAMRSQREVLEIEPLIFKLEQTVKSLDNRRKQESDGIDKLLEAQIERYLALPLSRAGKKQVKKFRKEYAALLAVKGGQAQLWQGFAEITDSIIAHYQEQIAQAGGDAPKGLLQRLFGQKTSDAQVAAPAMTSDAGVDVDEDMDEDIDAGEESDSLPAPAESAATEPAETVAGVIPGERLAKAAVSSPEEDASPEAQLSREMNLAEGPDALGIPQEQREEIKSRIRSILQQLLAQIDIPADLTPRKERLLARVGSDYPWEELPDLLAETSQLVASIRAVSQKEFEAFLLNLHHRLRDIQDFLLTARRGEEDSLRHQEKLDSEVRGELSNFRDAVHDDKGLPEIRQDIESMMARILGALDDFRYQETARREGVFEQMQAMMERMQTMEKEAADLRQSLESQREKAMHDALTGLPNRQAYDEQMVREYSRWRRHGHPLSVAVVDVDFFKRINDTLGHLRGDKVLRLVGREVQKRIRSEDFVARYGGEEFVVVMPDTDEASALKALDKVRQFVSECPFNFNNERVVITVSVGVAAFAPGDTPESVFERADQALYRAKHSGRNRVVCASMTEPPEAS